ncbi:MAG: DEAD/DEAH box helicase family protein [Potamolinea sp.]
MPFKLTRHSNISTETPEALYRDYRNRKIQGLLAHQADIIREYQKQALDAPDVALQLSTGSGKTLVGLLIGEWRRQRFQEKVVYLCPTRQLVNQVVEKSVDEYGIKANAFIGKQAEYAPNIKAEYRNAETLAVTTYNGLFNTNSFFDDASLIILDDAHAAENYIAKYWSLLIERKAYKILFETIVSAIRSILSPSDYSRLTSTSANFADPQWIEKIPTPDLYNLLPELTTLLDEHTVTSDLKYPWSVLRDHFLACHIYISVNAILIRPVIPLTRTHKPFSQAKQRLYMSATLGEGGELERLSGVDKIVRLAVPEGWDKQGIGRRLFFFPESALNEESALNLTIEMIQSTGRSLVLVPDDTTANDLKTVISKKTGYEIFDAAQIEQSKKTFVSKDKAVAIVANRYDGIDLAGDECRILIVKDLQRATNLQEKFLVTRLAAGVLLNDRILTRIVQAVGRCTRSATDYAAVIILGNDLNKILLDRDRRKFLHPEFQAEIEFGNEESKGVEESAFLDNFQIFLEHKEDWNAADEEIVSRRDSLQQEKLPAMDKLIAAVPHEVRYQDALWNSNFEAAVAECRTVLSSLSGDDVRGYRAFWNYLAGSAAWMGAKSGITSMESIARDFFKRAASTAPEVTWFSRLSRLSLEIDSNSQVDNRLIKVIEGLETQLEKLGTANDRKFESEVKVILENLNKDSEEDSKKFEDAHERLGRLLGYEAGNSKSDAAPDPWWVAGDNLCIVFEDHSGASQETTIGANKVRQAASHPNWIKENVQLLKNAEIIPVMVTPCKKIESGAVPHTQDVCYWNREEFRDWATRAIAVVRDLRRSFPGEADLEWRKRAIQKYQDGGINPASLVEKLRKQKLRDLPRQI